MTTIAFDRGQFEGAITAADSFLIVDFWAAWCGPCRQFGPIFERVSDKNPDITFAKVDTDAHQDLSAMAGIRSIPTLMVFRDGILLFNQPGALSERALEDVIAQVRGLDMAAVRAELDSTATSVEPDPGTVAGRVP
ncbi:MAG: thioredoxin [Microbacteriaceae bacterium]|nr:thioredoxin [Microbacteriaceae bacterium]